MKLEKSATSYNLGNISLLGARKKRALIKNLFDDFFKTLPQGASILEIGPGRGEFAEEALRRGYGYHGIEPSKFLSDELKRKGISISNTDVPPIEFPDKSFHMVYTFDVIEHFQGYNEAFLFIKDGIRVLKEGGMLCIIAPNFSTLGPLFFEYEYQHAFVTTQGRLKKMLSDAGLEITIQHDFLIRPRKGILSVFDRLLAGVLLPVARSPFIGILFAVCGQKNILYRLRKNLFDHILIMGQKKS